MTARLAAFTLLLLAAGSPAAAAPPARLAHVFVALCDNAHQGIVPVPAALGNGDDPAGNLYWGARFGVRGFLDRAPGWRRLAVQHPGGAVLERTVYRHDATGLVMVADAYRGSEIAAAVRDFLMAAAGRSQAVTRVERERAAGDMELRLGAADILAYVGHDGLMDAATNPEVAALAAALPQRAPGAAPRPVLILACASRSFFEAPLRRAGAEPLLWTTGLLAAEAYTLEAALVAWAGGAPPGRVRDRAAEAYASHQRCSVAAARRLFATGWQAPGAASRPR